MSSCILVYRQIAAGVGILVNIFEMWLTEHIQELLEHRSRELILKYSRSSLGNKGEDFPFLLLE